MSFRSAINFYRPFIILLIFLLSSCGKKAPPALPSVEPLPGPTNMTAVHRESEIILSWSYDEKAPIKGFVIERAEDGDFKKTTFIETGRLYRERDFKDGRLYRYRVFAKGVRGVSGISSELDISPLPPPSRPEGVSFVIGTESLTIKWSPPAQGLFFNIFRSAEDFRPLNKEPISETAFTDSLSPDSTVRYLVRALLNTPARDEGPPSDEITVTPGDFIPSNPEGLQAVLTEGGVQLFWKENPETWARGYTVYRAAEAGEFSLIGQTSTPAFLDREPRAGKSIYRVSAFGPAKEGPSSSAVEVEFDNLPLRE